MVGMLFLFIIMLMAFALNYRTAEDQAAETEAQNPISQRTNKDERQEHFK